MTFQEVCEAVASEFVARPVDFTVEYEVQARHYEQLRQRLAANGELETVGQRPTLAKTTDGYKRDYWQAVQSKWEENGGLTRVHPEVTVQKGERIDLAVLASETDYVEWHNGSKRFDANDLDAAFEVKYIKNKSRFPTTARVNRLRGMDDTQLRTVLDTAENGLVDDLNELGNLPDDVDTFLLLYSNKNYLYADPVTETEVEHEPVYERLGNIARDWLAATARENNTAVLYATPQWHEWLTLP